MARGTALSDLRQMFKAEVGLEMDETITSNLDARINLLLASEQQWLAGQHAFLLGKVRIETNLAAATRYFTFPESTIDIDRLSPVQFARDTATRPERYQLAFGIGQEHYRVRDSTLSPPETLDPPRRWDLIQDNGTLKGEIWPVPATNHVMILEGIKPLADLADDADTADLDDLVIVLFAAAEFLAERGAKNAAAKLARAQALLNSLKGSRASEFERFNFSGYNNQFGRVRPRGLRPVYAGNG